MATMRATVFHGVNDIRLDEVVRPRAGVGDAVIRITLTTICGTDLHIMRGEYPVKPGLIIGHEPVGVIEELGLWCDRVSDWGPGVGRSHHSVRSMPCVLVRASGPMWAGSGL